MESMTFVILAKSYKPGGRCIAGKQTVLYKNDTTKIGDWIRPVPNDGTGQGSIKLSNCRCDDGTDAGVLDIVEIPVMKHSPVPGQIENHTINEDIPWKKLSRLNPVIVPKIVDRPRDIWLDKEAGSNFVTFDYCQKGLACQSLYLIKPKSLLFSLSNDYNQYDNSYKPKISASFEYGGFEYQDIYVTCPSTKEKFANQYPANGGAANILKPDKGDDYVLCMSLTPAFTPQAKHYKLIATVFDFDGSLQREYSK